LLEGTNSWLAVGGPLDVGGAGSGGAADGAAGDGDVACRDWIGCRMVAADDWVAAPAPPPEPPGPPGPAPSGRAEVGVRLVAGASPFADGDPETTVGRARVPSWPDDVAEAAPSAPAAAPATVGASDSSVPLPAPPRFAEPVPVPPRDT
jgi:hypothetical protein